MASTDFVFTVTTTGSDETFTLPLYNGGTYNFSVDWGDSSNDTITSWDDADKTHTYASADTYTVTIDLSGAYALTGFQFNNGGDKTKIYDISQWGDLDPGNVTGHFYGCSNLTVSATDALDISSMTTMGSMFRGCSSLTSIDVSTWDVSSVTTFALMFYSCSSLTSVGDLDDWDTSAVTAMGFMFNDCSVLATVGDLSGWDVSKVTDMQSMFNACLDLTTVGYLNDWDTSAVTNMGFMFSNCQDLTTVGDLNAWDTSAVTIMYFMFYNCYVLTTVGDISDWDISAVTDMANMFKNGTALSQRDYDAILISWAAQAGLGSDLFDQETLGSDLVTNGGFDADTNWSKGTGWSIGSGVASCDGSQVANSVLYQTGIVTSGVVYEVTLDVTSSAGNLQLYLGLYGWQVAGSYIDWVVEPSGSYTFYLMGNSYPSSDRLNITVSAAFIGTVDNVTLKEVTAPHKGTYGFPYSVGDEAITAQNDRDFSSGTIGNWGLSRNGSGTLNYNTTDIGGADDKQGLLTSSGDSYLFATLSSTYAPLTAYTLYILSANIYVPEGNTNKNVEWGPSSQLSGAIESNPSDTLAGDTWTTVVNYVYIATDVGGNFSLGFTGNPADGDLLYFDSVSIRPVQTSWTNPVGTNFIEIDENEGAIKITYVDYSGGAIYPLSDAADLTADLIVGNWYKLTFTAKVGTGNTVQALVYSGVDPWPTLITTASIAETFTEYSLVFQATSVNDKFRFTEMAAGDIVWVKDITIQELSIQSAVDLHAGATTGYSPSVADDRAILTSAPYSWIITDGGEGDELNNLNLIRDIVSDLVSDIVVDPIIS